MVQVWYLLEVFILVHYGPPSTETPTTETTIVQCHKNSWIYLTSTYLLLVTFETNYNYSIRFEMKNTIRTALIFARSTLFYAADRDHIMHARIITEFSDLSWTIKSFVPLCIEV